ncbi:malonyl-[acyl-carrier protein] O-methyltransferase BioC [Salinivibrio kushneri]|uniref:malonyl-ACP O-methyltransferase BioC n=1 Tax=Salinivibrio kushneri TaxID=1908198 RepID=UPI0009899951|nr:malonyl-ACP O-methyltransferase BioC [Salinivibrio kushneri]OOE32610.1 malonyl-[acyl-carrier protein] O-methyltransferase BioC [Salinivibrio kushneri]
MRGDSVTVADKQAIARAFGRAAPHYDDSATLQRRVGHRLMALAESEQKAVRLGTVLDVGCGTGYFTQQWMTHAKTVIGLDLSAPMLATAKARCGDTMLGVQADAEHLPLADNSVDLAFSSLALQWCDDLHVPLAELSRVVKPGGQILVSTLLTGSLCELDSAWQQACGTSRVNRFITLSGLQQATQRAGLTQATVLQESEQLTFANAHAVMKSLKGIGATYRPQGAGQQGLATRAQFSAVEKAYQRFALAANTLPATYQIGYIVIHHHA